MDMDELRRAVDAVDDQLLDLLKRRQLLANRIGERKREQGIPIYDPVRENQILARLKQHNAGELSETAVLAAWREIFSASRAAQTRVRVAYLGPEGTFTQQAAQVKFGTAAELITTQSIAAAFAMVRKGSVDFAVLPVENTLQGVVGETVDLLGAARAPLVVGEVTIPIHFVFSSACDSIAEVRTVYSKQEAFPQCSSFLGQPALEAARRVPVASTSEAVLQAARDPAGAALSAEIAATLAGVPILFRNVENNAGNKTRFLVLAHRRPDGVDGVGADGKSGAVKTSVFAKVQNVAGGLEALLRAFRESGINLSKIESRPMDDAANFETWFYIEFEGSRRDLSLPEANELVWLGSYPEATITKEGYLE